MGIATWILQTAPIEHKASYIAGSSEGAAKMWLKAHIITLVYGYAQVA